MKIFAALPLILLSASAYALPAAAGNFTLSLTEITGTGEYLKGVADASRARAAYLKGRAPGEPATAPVIPSGHHVVAIVGVGDPAVYYQLLFDIASSITWCKSYVPSSTTKPTGQEVHIEYGTGSSYITGLEYRDRVALTLDLVIEDQSIGAASSVVGFKHADGILGLGPVELTRGKLYPNTRATVPTVMDNLHTQKKIKDKIFSVFLRPPVGSSGKGSVIFGGIDSSLYDGELTYVPVTGTYPASTYWGIDISSCKYGNDHTIIPTSTAGVVDTGSPLILLADDYFKAYMKAIPGAYIDHNVKGLMVISPEAFREMKPLHFTIGGRVFTLDVGAQLIPREQVGELGGDPGKHYSWIGRLGHKSGEGFDFLLGLPFLRRYYSVYDAIKPGRRRIGFAQTEYTFTG